MKIDKLGKKLKEEAEDKEFRMIERKNEQQTFAQMKN